MLTRECPAKAKQSFSLSLTLSSVQPTVSSDFADFIGATCCSADEMANLSAALSWMSCRVAHRLDDIVATVAALLPLPVLPLHCYGLRGRHGCLPPHSGPSAGNRLMVASLKGLLLSTSRSCGSFPSYRTLRPKVTFCSPSPNFLLFRSHLPT